MAPPKRYIQQIQLDGVLKKVLAKERNGQVFVLLQDVQDIFEGAKRFEYDGIGVPFMTDENDERITPLRIEYYEDCILDVIVGTASEVKDVSTPSEPISIPSQSTTPTTPTSSFTSSVTSPRSVSPVSVAPLSIVRPSMMGSLSSVPEAVDEAADTETALSAAHERALSTSSSSSDINRRSQGDTGGVYLRNESLDAPMSIPLHTVQTVHTTPAMSVKVLADDEPFVQEYTEYPLLQSSVYHGDATYQPRTAFNSQPLPHLPGQQGDISHTQMQSQLYLQQQQYQQQYQQQHQQQHQRYHSQQQYHYPQQQQYHYQQQYQQQHQLQQYQQRYQQQEHQQYQQQNMNQYQSLSTNVHDNPPIPARPHNIITSSHIPIHQFQQFSVAQAPQTLDPDGRALLALSPTVNSISESTPLHLNPKKDRFGDNTRNILEADPNLDYISESRNSQQESETKVKSLEMKLRRAQDQTLAYAKRNQALALESMQMSVKIMNRATLIQNMVQAVLTQNHELQEDPTPRLFIVLPVLTLDQTIPSKPTSAGDQRKFRLHFLCECGQYTRPLPNSGLNHIHFVEHEGYEIVRPAEFFEKYGAFIRNLSHLIRNGVHCGTVSIPPLLGSSDRKQHNRTHSQGQEFLRNQILDIRLTEAIEYLDSLDTPDLDGNQDFIESFDGTDIRQLQAYIKIPPKDIPYLANFYRIVTNRGHVKWICEDHFRSTIHYENELSFQEDVAALKGHYNLQIGQAKVQLETAQDASQFYKALTKAHNLHELSVGLRWQFTEGDLSKFVQAISDSRIRALALDGCRQKVDSSMKIMNFGKKYDPLLKIIFGSKIGSLKLINIPSMMLKISTKLQPLTQACGVKALHLENVGVLDFTGQEKGHSLSNLGLNNGPPRISALSFLTNILTNFRSLLEISLPGMNIRDDGVSLLTEQIHLQKTLKRINLYNNAISPTGGRLLAAFMSQEKAITHLDLGMNPIGDEALVQVIDSLGSKLSVLNLENTGFRENSAEALERIVATYNTVSDPEPHLEYLNLATNAWTTSSIQSLGRIIARLRTENPEPSSPSSPSVTSAMARRSDKSSHLEMGPAEAFLVVNSMIRTSQISLPTDRPWYEQPNILNGHLALTATKESYNHLNMKAQDSISFNSKLKVLRIMDAGLSEGAARYLISLLDVSVLTRLDLRRCIRLFKPREMLTILARIFPNSSYSQESETIQQQQKLEPQAPTPFGVSGSPINSIRFIHLNSTDVDDHVAHIIAQELESGWSCIERLDIGNNHLTHKGISLILKSLCYNTSLQHLNLGQNFGATNTVYQSSASTLAQSQSLREALLRLMTTNKTLEVLYFICTDVEVVAKGLSSNSTIKSLVFDRLEGTLKDIEAFGRALAVNQTLMRFKVYDNREAPFLQAYYGTDQQPSHRIVRRLYSQHQQTQYVDPFGDCKQDAVKTIEKGITFNESIIEFHWPEMFDRMQPSTEHLENVLKRNMAKLESASKVGDATQESYAQRASKVSRGLSILSTTSTVSNGSGSSPTSSLSSIPSSYSYSKDNSLTNNLTRSQSEFVPSASGPGDGYT
ncbi:hypothetical protein BGX21_009042, partial [Mortierella sp. AD011]